MEHRNCIFRFADVEVDERNFSVSKTGEVVPMEPKVFKVLQFLLHHPDRVVTKDELLDAVWSDTSVSESSLTRSVATLRRLLGDDIHEPRYIATIPTVGYRFLCEVQISENGFVPGAASDAVTEAQAQAAPLQSPAKPTIKTEQSSPEKKRPGKRRIYWVIGSIAVAIALVAILFLVSRPATPVVEGVSQITDDGNPKVLSALVSDGSRIYFNEIRDGTAVIAQVATTSGESGLVTESIPGSFLMAYASVPPHLLVSDNAFPCHLWILPLPAGEPRKLAELECAGDATLFPNGNIVFVKFGVLYLAQGDGSDPHKLFSFPAIVDSPVVSPDGRRIRVNLWRNELTREIWEVNSDGSNPHPVLKDWQGRFDARGGRWTADGAYFIFQSKRQGRSDLWVLPERTRRFGGEPPPIRLTNGPLSYELPFSSGDGKHLYVIGRKQRGELVRYDRNSQQFVPFLSGISAADATVSNDGKWVAYASYPDHSLWRSRIDGSDRLRLTYPPTWVSYPRISPDGTKVAFGSLDEQGHRAAYLISSDGGVSKKIVENALFGVNWSPDGNSVVANVGTSAIESLPDSTIQITDLRTGATHSVPDSAGKGGVWWPSLDMLLAPGCRLKCGFYTFNFTTQKWSYLVDSPFDHWTTSLDGKFLYYTTGLVDPKIMRIRFSDGKVEEIMSLKDFRRIEDEITQSWLGVTPDGDPLLTRDIGTDEIYDISLR